MVISLGRLVASADPHIRLMDPRRDGVALADMLETAFRDEPADDEGQAMLRMLRNFGVFDVSMTDGATGFVWTEDGRIVGNASLMRNRARPDTWLVGNVGTHPAFRGRGIATALVTACMRYAAGRGAARVGLQVTQTNTAAVRVYQRLGFNIVGLVSHYARPAMSAVPPEPRVAALGPDRPRSAGWRDSGRVWELSRRNYPAALTYAEAYSADDYRPGLMWRLRNALEGNPVTWLILGELGALRLRTDPDRDSALIELLPAADAKEDELKALLDAGLSRLNPHGRKLVQAHQSRLGDPGSEAAHAALSALGFASLRTLAHMLAQVERT